MTTTFKLTALVSLLLAGTAAFAADWSNNTLGYRYEPHQSEPGVSDKVAKQVLNFTHVSGDKLGTNLFIIDLLKSNSADPAAGGGTGAQEWYGFYERDFSVKALSGNTTGYGYVQDYKLVARVDAGTKNTAFAPSPRKLRVGVSAALLPAGGSFWDVGVQAYKETNHNGIVGQSVTFKTAPALVTAWAIPVSSIGVFKGFVDIIGPKGKDGFGNDTKTETLARAMFMFNVMGPASNLTAGFGVEYWGNKFGADNSSPLTGPHNSAKATTPMLLIEYKL